ncbi:hypothetical protein BCR33DRAFT_194516 [Rhizoclosmatium globosum]|uniref:Uncharacterized protein n=1 Tax=Rhizoclosmatium globosum TaxID=329046 RepID=A0A1Y2CDN4_9FUNG|nr:hypothetical protein BCR33DRAFT_194516 [Rhizoclosmatium globosum]|eukprot:ORY45171.1 hypothetical protein BCR33DRAFT_194516 [Rhizoclosmatium globosum]
MADEQPKAPTPLAALLARKKAEKERESGDTSAVNALGQPETRDKDDDSDSLENRAHVLEAEVRLIRSQLVSAEEKAARVDSLVMELVAERELKQTANEAIQLKEAEINSLKLESINLEEKNSLLAEQVTRKEKEHEEAKETIHRLQTELESLQNDLKSTSQQAHSSQSEETKYRIHTLAVEKERNELKLNVDWLNSEIEKKSAEFREFREENSAKVAELKKTVDALTFEKAALEQRRRHSLKSPTRTTPELQNSFPNSLIRKHDTFNLRNLSKPSSTCNSPSPIYTRRNLRNTHIGCRSVCNRRMRLRKNWIN